MTPTTTSPRTEPMIDVCSLPLSRGAHESPDVGMCVMEMASYLAHEPWSDAPQCASPVIAQFCRSWNDALNDADRQMLKPYAFKVIGTRTTDADEETRAWLATDWLCRVQTPAWLRLAGLMQEAQALEACARIVDAVTARAAQPALDAARERAVAARDAAGAVAWDAAGAAAWAAAGAAAWAAAGAAARDAARAVAWDAARDAARDAAWDAAWAAAWDAAWDAAWAAAWDAAGDAAWERLRPTVEALQASALTLLDAMCAVGRVA